MRDAALSGWLSPVLSPRRLDARLRVSNGPVISHFRPADLLSMTRCCRLLRRSMAGLVWLLGAALLILDLL